MYRVYGENGGERVRGTEGTERLKKKTNKPQLTEGSVGRILIQLTIPMSVGIVGMVAFNLVDTFYVGRLGTLELAAMSFTFPVVLVVSSIARGLGVGTSAVVSRAIGRGDHERIKRLTTDSLSLSLIIVLCFVIAAYATIDPLFQLLGAKGEVLVRIKSYMSIWYFGMPFVVIPMVGNNAIRATGDMKTPTAIMFVAICVNLVLDPVLIFGLGPFPRMGLPGAALSTVIARAVTMMAAILVLGKREKMITLKQPHLREVFRTWKQVLFIGLPAAATFIIIPLSVGFITRLVSAYGASAVAGLGVANRIETFALTLIAALSNVLVPFVGQNSGAGKISRIEKSVRYSHLFSLGWGVLLFLIFLFLGKPIAGIFNKDPDVIGTTVLYLGIISLSYGCQGIVQLNSSIFNALRKPIHAAGLSLMRIICFLIPFAFLGSCLFGISGIFAAVAVANVSVALISYFLIRVLLKSL